MEDEDMFEPDYNEDFQNTTLDKGACNDRENVNQKLICVIPEKKSIKVNKPVKVSEKTLSIVQNNHNAVDLDDYLEGDGVLSDDQFEDVKACFSSRLEQNIEKDLKKMYEEELKVAIQNKQWEVLVNVLKSSLDANLREQLCFFCADLLTSLTEFLGISKYFQKENGNIESVALIGSKLLVNADLCSNYKAGTMILKIMVEGSVWFHYLNIKTFSVTDVVKSAIQSCLHENNFLLLSNLIKKTELFSTLLPQSLEDKFLVSTRMTNLRTFFHRAIQPLAGISDLTEAHGQLASACLSVLKIFVEAGQHVCTADSSTNFQQFFSAVEDDVSSKIWLLCQIFISLKKLIEISTVVKLSFSYPDLIMWSSFDYKIVISFFNSFRYTREIYQEGEMFLSILHRENVVNLPYFKGYVPGVAFLKIYTSMPFDEMKLYVSLYANSVAKYNKGKFDVVNWSLFLVNKSLTSVEFNEANRLLRGILNSLPFLFFTYAHKSYAVRQHFKKNPLLSRRRRLPPASSGIMGQFNASNDAPKLELSEANNINRPTKNPQDGLLPSTSDIPSAVMNHPRFSLSLKGKSCGDDLTQGQKALFSKTFNIQKGPAGGESKSNGPKIRAWADSEVYQKLRHDVNSRLTCYISNGDLSSVAARYLLLALPDKLFNCLPRDATGRAIYGDDTFEKVHELMNADINAALRQNQ